MRHIMLDLETMGTAPGSAIVQIGAVEFSVYKVCEPFSVNVSLQSCGRAGLRMDPQTVLWWMGQAGKIDPQWVKGGVELREALQSFTEWLGDDRPAVWGDGAAFDNVLLASAYRACGLQAPWHYSRDRCFRTMKELFPVERVVSSTLHDAASDAVAQAKQMQSIIAKYAIRLE